MKIHRFPLKKVLLVITLLALFITSVSIVSGCSSKSSYGKDNTGSGDGATLAAITVADILKQPDMYSNQTVQVKGKIVSECGSGCWFFLKDDTGQIYVDLAPSNLAIPQKVGSNVTVQGKVTQKGSDIYLIGSKVDF